MRIDGQHYRDEWLSNSYAAREIGDHFVRISKIGTAQILSVEEERRLNQVSMDNRLFTRLEKSGHILTDQNASSVLGRLKTWHKRTYEGPALHIVVLTKRCNLDCTYCHMYPENISEPGNRFDLQKETAQAVIRFALGSPNPRLTFEFQGGEPFLNFPVMKYFVEEALRQNSVVGKKISFAVTSNLTLVQDEHLEFCNQHRMSVAYSLNGPADVHDTFRITRNGSGSFETVRRKLEHFKERYPNTLFGSPLCVIGPQTAPRLIELLDWYHAQGFPEVAMIRLKPLGNVKKNAMPFDAEAFIHYYLSALDYLYEKNKNFGDGPYSERLLRVALAKILNESDIGFMDWRNPNADFSGTVTYDYDGTILPMDEARSLRPAFELGNVLKDSYDDVIRREKTFETMNLSLRDADPICRECSWNPYCGVLPVLDYARTGDPTPRPHNSPECLFVISIFDWIFKKLLSDPLPLLRMLRGMDKLLAERARALTENQPC